MKSFLVSKVGNTSCQTASSTLVLKGILRRVRQVKDRERGCVIRRMTSNDQKMKYLEAKKQMNTLKKSAVFVLYGEERYLIESMIKAIVEQRLTNDEQTEQWITYDLEEQPVEEAIMEAETFPFFGDKKVVVCENSMFLTAKPSKSKVEHNSEILLSYQEQPVDFSTLILVVPYQKLDERKKITKQLKKNATFIECQAVNDWDIDKWVTHFEAQFSLNLDGQTKKLIQEEIGPRLQLLENEMEKLALFKGNDETISYEDAQALVSHLGQSSGLKLVDAVIEKDIKKAIEIYKDLSRSNEEEIALLALLSSQLRTIYQVKILMQKGYQQQQIAQQLRVHSFVVKMSMERAKRFTIEDLYRAIDYCGETDQLIKQGKMDKPLAFEMLLYQLIHWKVKPVM
ncbi:DNA polymerase III delta subunit [Streptohalobacillus salinus]|uniref:DNA polymerase III subunit delta n=2 Tax=Streptohalobacillus salinus TaxID=621096 RepID=A0A2V3WAW8_9BACI|nr:DNA polymerase III delta subunit [Streptohalobacillus salinus]